MKIGFTRKDSPIHKLNPSLKFIAFIVIIVMIFLPLGFFAQMIIGILLVAIYIFSKLSFNKIWNILKSVLFLFLVLLLVNWVIYKTPIGVYLPNGYFPIMVGNQSILNYSSTGIIQPSANGTSYVSNLFGGKIIGFFGDDLTLKIAGKTIGINQIIYDPSNLANFQANGDKLFNSLTADAQNQLIEWIGDGDLAIKYNWILRSGFIFENQKYILEPLSNTNGGILNGMSAVVYHINWYTLSPRAFQLAIYVSVKVFLMILAATVLTATTNSIELAYALEDILSPLKIFKFPVVEASMMIAIALRFVPSLLSESQRILNAQSSRGVDFKNGSIKDKFKSMISLVVPLFNIAFLKSGELANAMEARAYSTRHSRSRYRTFKLHVWDWIAFAILCLATGLLIGIIIKPLLFTPFGLFELGILI